MPSYRLQKTRTSVWRKPSDGHPSDASFHRTARPSAWWEHRVAGLELPIWDRLGFACEDFCRGTNNGPIDENYRDRPDIGFRFVARQG
jgi:hypothetical protein